MAASKEVQKMEYQRLGASGLKISKIVLGAMSIGSPDWQKWVLNEEESLPLLLHAYKIGINTWDTADMYSHGVSERVIGKAIEKYHIPRKNLVILSKCFFGIVDEEAKDPEAPTSVCDGELLNQKGLSRKHILEAVDNSVRRLGTYIDILQIHRLDKEVSPEEIMRALNDVVESGKVRYIGASSMATWEFQRLQHTAEKHGWHKFISMQNFYNLIYREEEREMIPFCKETGVGLIPWSPNARGVLSRPFDSEKTARMESDRILSTIFAPSLTDADREVTNRVEEVAKKRGVAMAQVATAWVLSKGCCPIVGMSSIERMDAAVEALSVKLTVEECTYLEEAYLPKPVYGH